MLLHYSKNSHLDILLSLKILFILDLSVLTAGVEVAPGVFLKRKHFIP